jgi:hypothetical protein
MSPPYSNFYDVCYYWLNCNFSINQKAVCYFVPENLVWIKNSTHYIISYFKSTHNNILITNQWREKIKICRQFEETNILKKSLTIFFCKSIVIVNSNIMLNVHLHATFKVEIIPRPMNNKEADIFNSWKCCVRDFESHD